MNNENYIVINGKKAELTEEQLKALGIEVKKKRNNPFNSELKREDIYVFIQEEVKSTYYVPVTDKHRLNNANSFNDRDFANQVYLHELLNRKLLKYAWDSEAEDVEWDNKTLHYYIMFNRKDGIFTVDGNMLIQSQNVYFSKKRVAENAISDIIEPFIEEHPEFIW